MKRGLEITTVLVFSLVFLFSGHFSTLSSEEGEKNGKEEKVEKAEEVKASDYYGKGRSAYLLFTPKGFKEAMNWYEKALQVDRNFAPAYAGLGETYSSLGFWSGKNGKEFENFYNKSFVYISKALELAPQALETHRALALSYLHLGRLIEAKREAEFTINLSPKSAEAYYILWAATGRQTDSPNIKKALELNPNLAIAHSDLGTAYFWNNDYDRAIYHYKRSIEISPDNVYVRGYLANALSKKGRVAEALKVRELEKNKKWDK